MKALIHTAFGAPRDVLEIREIAQPEIAAGQVLVRVRAVSASKGDWLIARGLPYIARPMYGIRTPKEPVAGLAFAGTLEAVGAGVSDFAQGDDVFGTHAGALAEFVAVPGTAITRKPARVTFEQAAAAPVSGLAALQAVRRANVRAGQRVLITGASGSVGSFAVQIAKADGAHVTGVASTRNLEFLRAIGADDVIDYTRQEISPNGKRYDVIIDIAGNRPVKHMRSALTPDGTLMIVGGTGGNVTMGFGRTIRATMLDRFVKHRIVSLLSMPNADDLRTLADLLANGSVTPAVQATYPLADAAAAIDDAGNGHASGVNVVTV